MPSPDVVVIGAGISWTSFAFHAARAGQRVLVVERETRAGGCLHTERTDTGFWYELGAHTCYNSYQTFLELIEGCGLAGELEVRGKPVLRFLAGNELVPGQNLGLLWRQLDKCELLRALPRWRGAQKEGQSVRAYYSRLIGAGNYERVLAALLAAVPSQPADDFPAEMLFKQRARRRDVPRSFTLKGGLQRVVEGVLRQPRIETRLGRTARAIERAGAGFRVHLDDGERCAARILALAVPPSEAAMLLAAIAPRAAACAAEVKETAIESLGFALPSAAVSLPYATFLVPRGDCFHSCVTRDVVPDARWRAFTFHFRPETGRAQRLQRAAEVLHLRSHEFLAVTERRGVLPAPTLGHERRVRALDQELAGLSLAVTGNWFGGLAIEDCVQRSRAEWQRVSA